jgi:ubiquinone/menaquinone biosynthesis C-methylase UbiE
VRTGGRVASLEFGIPQLPPLRAAWRVYTGVGLPLLGLLAGAREWYEVGRFLGPSIRGFYAEHPLATLAGYWREAGLVDVVTRPMSFGAGIVMSARRG